MTVDCARKKIKDTLNQDYLEKHGTVDSITLPDDSLSGSIPLSGEDLQGPAFFSGVNQPPTWKCQLFRLGDAYYLSIHGEVEPPNRFWRLMQRLILGNRWIKL